MGAFICTLSKRDWNTTLTKGIYGNRYFKEGTETRLKDTQQLSIIRDLVSMSTGDIVFFHIRGEQTIHGVYRVRVEPFFDESSIWNDPIEPFPYRFMFEPHPIHMQLCNFDACTDVHSLYRLIDKGEIRSLVTLEFERNIERRSVRKILTEDAEKIIRLIYRDFHLKRNSQKIDFNLTNPPQPLLFLKDKIYKVGRQENAVKAILLYELAHRTQDVISIKRDGNIIKTSFKEYFGLPDQYDFINEFFIAPATRRLIDILITSDTVHVIIEVKTARCDSDALKQILYYRDLLKQRPWIKDTDKVIAALVAQRFSNEVLDSTEVINKVEEPVKLIKYLPTDNNTWTEFQDVTPS